MQKTIREKNKAYVEWIKSLPCLICGKESEPHHVPRQGHSGMGTKASDCRAINLCHEHPAEYHNQGKKTFATKYAMDYEHVISKLNAIYEILQ
jgi:hypothetical protein